MPIKKRDLATYKGRTYGIRWQGKTKFGERTHLEFLDGSKSFWVDSSLVTPASAGAGARAGREKDPKWEPGAKWSEDACYMCGSHYCDGAEPGGLCDDD